MVGRCNASFLLGILVPSPPPLKRLENWLKGTFVNGRLTNWLTGSFVNGHNWLKGSFVNGQNWLKGTFVNGRWTLFFDFYWRWSRYARMSGATHVPSWGYLKVNFSESLSIFGDECPQNGSKNEPMTPRTNLECPHEGPRVDDGAAWSVAHLSHFGRSPNLHHFRLWSV